MNKKTLTALILSAASLSSEAATVLIDGSINAGGFESSTGWVGTGDLTDTQINSNETVTTGDNAVVGVNATSITRFIGRDTGHIIAAGDQFDGGFSWLDIIATNSSNGFVAADGSIDYILFTTNDNTIGGTRDVIQTWQSGPLETTGATEMESFGQTVAYAGPLDTDGGAARTVFVSFETNEANARSFARIDDVTLNVTSIPEPSSTALLGLSGLALILRRRK